MSIYTDLIIFKKAYSRHLKVDNKCYERKLILLGKKTVWAKFQIKNVTYSEQQKDISNKNNEIQLTLKPITQEQKLLELLRSTVNFKKISFFKED